MTMCGSTDPSPSKRFLINTMLMLFSFILYKKRNIHNIKINFDLIINDIEKMLEILRENSFQKTDLKNLLTNSHNANQ